jgi:hypothetical protein
VVTVTNAKGVKQQIQSKVKRFSTLLFVADAEENFFERHKLAIIVNVYIKIEEISELRPIILQVGCRVLATYREIFLGMKAYNSGTWVGYASSGTSNSTSQMFSINMDSQQSPAPSKQRLKRKP